VLIRCRLRHLRTLDRELHVADYPNLEYCNLFLLKDGYKNYYQTFPVCARSQ